MGSSHFNHWVNDIYINQTEPNFECFSMARLISRFQHIQVFRDALPDLMKIYARARVHGAKGTDMSIDEIFTIYAKRNGEI